jgi:hypothetical protein
VRIYLLQLPAIQIFFTAKSWQYHSALLSGRPFCPPLKEVYILIILPRVPAPSPIPAGLVSLLQHHDCDTDHNKQAGYFMHVRHTVAAYHHMVLVLRWSIDVSSVSVLIFHEDG